jgi:hypothetical protein
MKTTKFFRSLVGLLLLLSLLLGACSAPEMPQLPELPALPEIPDLSQLPGIPENLRDLPNLLTDLGLPDLSSVANLPGLDSLPALQTPPGAISFSGPTEWPLNIGDRIPGTDIVLSGVSDAGAEFQIAGLRSVRGVGDSLDFDGDLTGISGVTYNLRLRIYYIGSDAVRAAGVQRLLIRDIQPQKADVTLSGMTMKLPFTVNVSNGEAIVGTTLGYAGMQERGGQITGLPEGDYPFLKIGDSISWKGYLRPDLPIEYNLRMIYYDANRAQVGGIVTLALPSQ